MTRNKNSCCYLFFSAIYFHVCFVFFRLFPVLFVCFFFLSRRLLLFLFFSLSFIFVYSYFYIFNHRRVIRKLFFITTLLYLFPHNFFEIDYVLAKMPHSSPTRPEFNFASLHFKLAMSSALLVWNSFALITNFSAIFVAFLFFWL